MSSVNLFKMIIEKKNKNKGFTGFACNFNIHNKTYYNGYWLNGNKEGKGKLYQKNGLLIYDGNWKNNRFNGYGILYYPNGNRYEGNFKDDIINGKGKYILSNNMISYDGLWLNGCPLNT